MKDAVLARDCDVIRIPAGDHVTLPKGTELMITQSLGGSFTVQVPAQGLFRISGKDAEAIGEEVPAETLMLDGIEGAVEERVEAALATCYDPEIPVNIVELGLVYDTRITERDGGEFDVAVKMTLTASGCGMGASIAADAEQKLLELDGIGDASVEVVWEPPWNPQMISEEGRKKLGIG
ncbi:MAG: iron-sulfur cluster assembly protein [Deltaproteobacteria bacterium]